MIRKQIDFHSEEINEIRTLYQQAFPKNEQTDLIWLFDDLHKGIIYGYYQENQLVGFAILCIQSQIAHILYLAVKKEYRDQGIGSYILNDLAKQYDSKKIIVDIEKIKECNGISEERIKKIPLPIVKKVKLVGDNLEFTTTMPRIKLDIPKRQKSMGFINIGTILLLIAVVVCFILGNR